MDKTESKIWDTNGSYTNSIEERVHTKQTTERESPDEQIERLEAIMNTIEQLLGKPENKI